MITAMALVGATHRRAQDICRCGHDRDVHEHFRAGTDCSACGPLTCDRFKARRPQRRRRLDRIWRPRWDRTGRPLLGRVGGRGPGPVSRPQP